MERLQLSKHPPAVYQTCLRYCLSATNKLVFLNTTILTGKYIVGPVVHQQQWLQVHITALPWHAQVAAYSVFCSLGFQLVVGLHRAVLVHVCMG
jgi:hypothetical protein